jgi:hypothetical protein
MEIAFIWHVVIIDKSQTAISVIVSLRQKAKKEETAKVN